MRLECLNKAQRWLSFLPLLAINTHYNSPIEIVLMRKKILILGHGYATQFIDVYNQYTRLFDPAHFAVTVAYLTGEPDDGVRLRTLAENILFLDASKKETRGLKIPLIRRLYALCKNEKYEIIVCHRYKPIYIMMLVAQFIKIPALFFVLHELHTMRAWGRQLFIACLKRKNMIFAGVSNAVRDDLRKHLWGVRRRQIQTLYNVIDINLTQPNLLTKSAARQQYSIPDTTFVFGTIGRLAINKDQATLIQAFAKIKQTCPHALLIIMGDGELESPLKSLTQSLGICDSVIFTGFVAQAHAHLPLFDCFVLPSIQEAFGRVLLEAMIAKLPIITTKVNGIPEVVGDAATLIEPKNVSALAKAMQDCYEQSANAREQQGEKAYAHVSSQYSIPNFYQQFWQMPLVQAMKE